jgi:hypothetical protein
MTKHLGNKRNLIVLIGSIIISLGLNGCQVSSDDSQNGAEPKQEDITASVNGAGSGNYKKINLNIMPATVMWIGVGDAKRNLKVSEDGYVIKEPTAPPLILNGKSYDFFIVNNSDGTISIRTGKNGRYLCADSHVDPMNPNPPLVANRDIIGPWEKFTKQNVTGGFYLISGNNNKYIGINSGRLAANNIPEVFNFVGSSYVGSSYNEAWNVTLKSTANNQYVCAATYTLDPGYPLNANRASAGPWETFDLIFMGPWFDNQVAVALRARSNYKFVCADYDVSKVLLYNNRTDVDTWEIFILTDLGNNQITLKCYSGNNGYVGIYSPFDIHNSPVYANLSSGQTFVISQIQP